MNIENLQGVIPKSVMAELPAVMAKFNINTPLRLAHFLSQCHHESAGFQKTAENLIYIRVDRIVEIFRKRVDTNKNGIIEQSERNHAAQYVSNPEKFGNFFYANRMGNGDEASGDGYAYRGRGFIQLTGRDNYSAFNALVDDDVLANPNLVSTKYPLTSAAYFFDYSGILPICDKGNRVEVITAVTKRVNGGVNGIDDRIALFGKYSKLLRTGT